MGNYKSIENNNRIVYVDPNDVRGSISNYDNGEERLVPLAPDYTEFCIWCNLIVEHSSRLKNHTSGENEAGTTIISFDMTSSDNGANFVSFMQGKDADNYNFLTTDYTNIDYGSIRERNIIEGLQIEKVDISFTNYQTPQVTIKFVDIRGGGFFGREEATHDAYGGLTNLETTERNKKIDNLFSCFVSFPYPRFRLQVKGFYGKPVTFQLTCTSFIGNFNANTGNFEITVQFIGYEYGLLGDIPFDLLVAAPLTQTGSEYWDEHVADMVNNKWCLDKEGTEAPCKLYDFYKNVAKELDSSTKELLDESIIDDSIETFDKATNNQIDKLNEISQYIKDFKQALIAKFKPDYITDFVNDSENIVIIYSPSEVVTLTQDICSCYNKLGEAVENYNNIYAKADGGISTSLIPNTDGKDKWVKWTTTPVRLSKFIEHKISNNNGKDSNIIVTINSKNKNSSNPIVDAGSCCDYKLVKMYSSKWYTISPGVSERIYSDLSKRDWALYGKDTNRKLPFAPYAMVVDFGNTSKEINIKISELIAENLKQKESLNKGSGRTIKDIVGFSPFVGRYFKVVMCHLETLVHIFNFYADGINEDIKEQKRKPFMLGIKDPDKETDVPSSTYGDIPPFPAVYKKYSPNNDNSETPEDKSDALMKAWIGDFKGDWRERTMVEEIFKAAQRISNDRVTMTEVSPVLEGSFNSIMPIDLYYGIPNYAYNTVDGAIFYAGLRAEITLNFMQNGIVMNPSDAEILGMYDAYVFTKQSRNKAFIKSLATNEDFIKHLYDYCAYGTPFKTHEPFLYEFAKVYEGRHPLFKDNGMFVKYNYMTNSDTNTEYIPMENINTFDGINGYSKYYMYTNDNNFTPKADSGYFLASGSYANSYENLRCFNIVSDDEKVKKILDIYNNLGTTLVEIGNTPQNFMETINKYVHVNDDEYKLTFYDGKDEKYYRCYNGYGLEEAMKVINENWSEESVKKQYKDYVERDTYGAKTYKNFKDEADKNVLQKCNELFEKSKYPRFVDNSNNFGYIVPPEPALPPFLPEESNGNGEYGTEYPFIHASLIQTIVSLPSSSQKTINTNLLSHSFYYLQNHIKDIKTRDSVKALLFLHSLPFSYEKLTVKNFKPFFNGKNNGGIEQIPYGYILFLGGLIWRKRYVDEHNEDPIEYGNGFLAPTRKDAPLFVLDNGKAKFACHCNNVAKLKDCYVFKYSDFLQLNDKPSVEDSLLKEFNEFVDSGFKKIMQFSELYKVDREGKKYDLTMNDIRLILSKRDNFKSSAENVQACMSLLNGYTPFYDYSNNIFGEDGLKNIFYLRNFRENYTYGSIVNNIIDSYYSENSQIQECFRILFFNKVIAVTLPTTVNENGIAKSVINAYFNGYIKSIESYSGNETNKEEIEESEKQIEDSDRDLKCEIYQTLKNIWDRWLCGYYNQKSISGEIPGRELFEVKNFFCNNFMFIDTFYNNIYDKLRLNCTLLKEDYMGTGTGTKLGKTIVTHLGDILGHHRCLMFNFPDAVNFSNNDGGLLTREQNMLQNMKDVFTPLAANKVTLPEYTNKFTVIYTHSSDSLDIPNRAKFNTDSFDIWSSENGTDVAPNIFKKDDVDVTEESQENATNEAITSYKVPSFGVAYSRQNNSFWKNISVGMENFSVTEQAIKAEANIIEKGSSEKHYMTFYGQDLYSIYQSYSYIVTIEMLGDAQIQPLMYFQLMNVPMFRGTYLIIKVEHHITQGNMITSFSGMKMSKVQVPFTTSWFTVSNDEDYVDSNQDESSNGEEMTATDGTAIDIEDNELSIAIKKYLGTDGMLCDDFVMKVYNELGVKINNKLN